MDDPQSLFATLRNSADPEVFAAIEALVRDGEDRHLVRINVLAFAVAARPRRGKGHQRLPARRAARPVRAELERAVPRLRRRAARQLPAQVGAPGGLRLRAVLAGLRADARRDGRGRLHGQPAGAPDRGARSASAAGARNISGRCSGAPASICRRPDSRAIFEEITIDSHRAAGRARRRSMSVQLPAEFVIVFEPVTHAAHFIDVKGEPTKERQTLSLIYDKVQAPTRDHRDAARPAAAVVREPHRARARCRRCGSPATRCTTCSASAGRSSPPSGCSPTRRSATSIAPTRSTWTRA